MYSTGFVISAAFYYSAEKTLLIFPLNCSFVAAHEVNGEYMNQFTWIQMFSF
jgi:hypothetical protein